MIKGKSCFFTLILLALSVAGSSATASTIERSAVFDLSSVTVQAPVFEGSPESTYLSTGPTPINPFSATAGDRVILTFTFLPGQTLLINALSLPFTSSGMTLLFGPTQSIGTLGSGSLSLNAISGSTISNPIPTYTNVSGAIGANTLGGITASSVEISGGVFDFTLTNTGYATGYFNEAMLYALGGPAEVLISPIPEPNSTILMLAGLGLVGAVARRKCRPSTEDQFQG